MEAAARKSRGIGSAPDLGRLEASPRRIAGAPTPGSFTRSCSPHERRNARLDDDDARPRVEVARWAARGADSLGRPPQFASPTDAKGGHLHGVRSGETVLLSLPGRPKRSDPTRGRRGLAQSHEVRISASEHALAHRARLCVEIKGCGILLNCKLKSTVKLGRRLCLLSGPKSVACAPLSALAHKGARDFASKRQSAKIAITALRAPKLDEKFSGQQDDRSCSIVRRADRAHALSESFVFRRRGKRGWDAALFAARASAIAARASMTDGDSRAGAVKNIDAARTSIGAAVGLFGRSSEARRDTTPVTLSTAWKGQQTAENVLRSGGSRASRR